MQVYPFDGYLTYFPSSYAEIEVERDKLKKFAFPVDAEILESKGIGLAPTKRIERDFFNIRELIGYTRMHSIPNLGYISKKPIRAAEILGTEIVQDKETGEERIKTVFVACAFMRSKDNPQSKGKVVFICPFCGCLHSHGCGGEKFGDGDGDRVPHCRCDIPAYYRLNSQKYGLMLAQNWHFNLVETDDFTRAGDFPKKIAKDILTRLPDKA